MWLDPPEPSGDPMCTRIQTDLTTTPPTILTILHHPYTPIRLVGSHKHDEKDEEMTQGFDTDAATRLIRPAKNPGEGCNKQNSGAKTLTDKSRGTITLKKGCRNCSSIYVQRYNA